MNGRLLAISDLHVGYAENRRIVDSIRPRSDSDWLILAGDVSENHEDIEWVLHHLARRFAKVIWAPGNHELWSHPSDQLGLKGEERYRQLVSLCRALAVATPEDPYPVWEGDGGPLVVAPLFLLYDYTFRMPGVTSKDESLRRAQQAHVVCADERYLFPDPYPSREAWCHERVSWTEQRLAAIDQSLRTILINHFPLVRRPTDVLRYPEFAQWCGTELTADWHVRFRASAVVYGHLHIPRTTWYDGVRFEEVSLGYPRERRYRLPRRRLRLIAPAPPVLPAKLQGWVFDTLAATAAAWRRRRRKALGRPS
jgi:3',5'-cyclic AMP phosphodiesterase CpdA